MAMRLAKSLVRGPVVVGVIVVIVGVVVMGVDVDDDVGIVDDHDNENGCG